jgi:bacillithiol biosynthesis deacetylase BshB1
MNVLAIGIHPDDVELSCGGTVTLAAGQGHKVTVVDLADGAASTNGTVADREREALEAAKIMGIAERRNLSLPDTGLRSDDPDQIREVVGAIRWCRPDIMLAPSSDDPHPDHAAGGELIRRALYLSGLLRYPADGDPWSVERVLIYGGRTDIEPHLIFDITDVQETKMRAILAHETQFVMSEDRHPTPLNAPEFMQAIEARDRSHGRRIRVMFGEGFALHQPLAVTGLSILGVPGSR